MLGLAAVALPVAASPAQAFLFDWEYYRRTGKRRSKSSQKKQSRKTSKTLQKRKLAYKGREIVAFSSAEKPGTIIIKTGERALYQVIVRPHEWEKTPHYPRRPVAPARSAADERELPPNAGLSRLRDSPVPRR